jgi:hypothetical protein
MRIIHVKSAGILESDARKRMEGIFYPDVTTAVADLKHQFPNHVVSVSDDCIRVTNRDGSVNVALFKEEEAQNHWVETNFGLRDTNE